MKIKRKIIRIDEEKEPRHEECWAKLTEILEAYKKEGKTVYTVSGGIY